MYHIVGLGSRGTFQDFHGKAWGVGSNLPDTLSKNHFH